jgi:hypothetical protein
MDDLRPLPPFSLHPLLTAEPATGEPAAVEGTS